MRYSYKTRGVCSSEIAFDIDDKGIVTNVKFTGGCNGNLKAISKLVEGWHYKEIVARTLGNTCGPRSTSCADQFATALTEAAGKAGLE